MSGKHVTGTVIYGYLWDEKRENWVIDDVAAPVVRRIFDMTMEGYGPYQIANRLEQDQIEIPAIHLARHGEGPHQGRDIKNPYGWASSTVVNILKKREYLGHTVNFKTRKHFKDKKSRYVDEGDWMIFENTHEAIVSQELFNNVQRIRGNVKRYPNGWGEAAPLTGLMYCADCGGKMYVHRTYNGKRIPQYTCSQYTKIPVGDALPHPAPYRGEGRPVAGVRYASGHSGVCGYRPGRVRPSGAGSPGQPAGWRYAENAAAAGGSGEAGRGTGTAHVQNL